MKKKLLISLILIVVAAYVAYRFVGQNNMETEISDQSDTSQNIVEGDTSDEDVERPAQRRKILNNSNKDSMDQFEEYYDKVESQWVDKITQVLREEFKLSDSSVEGYFDLRSAYEDERLDEYEKYHEKMVQDNGEDFEFNVTEEAIQKEIFMLNERYSEKLRALIGEEKYKRYLEVRDEFNRQLKLNEGTQFEAVEINF